MDYSNLIGKRIKLTGLAEGVKGERSDLTGIVEDVAIDADRRVELLGTWGPFPIHPDFDEFEVVSSDRIGNIEVYDEWFHRSISFKIAE